MPADAQIGLGLAALGRPGYITLGHSGDTADPRPEAMERAAHGVLDAAYDGGVRAFDAARSYGAAEAFLGSWIAARAPADLYVSSKWGYEYTAGPLPLIYLWYPVNRHGVTNNVKGVRLFGDGLIRAYFAEFK